MVNKIEITTWTIIKILLIFIGIVFIWAIRDVILLLLLVFVIVAALGPIVDWFESLKVPRVLSVIIVYIFFLGLVAVVLALIIPPLVSQTKALADDLPYYTSKVLPVYHSLKDQPGMVSSFFNQSLDALSEQLSNSADSAFQISSKVLSGLGALVIVIVLTFYLLLAKDGIRVFIESLVPKGKKEQAVKLFNQVSAKWGGWLRGQFLLMLIIGVFDFIGLTIFKIPFALPLAITAGFLELIPYIGPILGAVPAVLVAFTISPWAALFVAIWYFAIQQLESTFIVPTIMRKTIGLSPIITIIAILIGAKLKGILGIVLAVPTAAGLTVFYEEWQRIKNNRESEKNGNG